MKLRHRLLRFLALGDMVILNADLGIAISIGHHNPGGALHFETYGAQGMTLADCQIDMSPPVRNLAGAGHCVSAIRIAA